MSAEKTNNETEERDKKVSALYKLSKPLRYINFPIGCLIFSVVYWLIFIPILYHVLFTLCEPTTCNWRGFWRYLFWSLTSLAWVIIISAAICYWSCTAGDDDDEEEEEDNSKEEKKEKSENDKLLSEQVLYNNIKNENLSSLSITNEKTLAQNETIERNLNVESTESKIEKTVVTLPIRKSVTVTEGVTIKEAEIKPVKDVKQAKPIQNATPKDQSMVEEIENIFPRCSVRRKPEPKKRPDTLIIHSPKYPKEEHEIKRYSVQEQPKTTSPLTPREMFFYDLIHSANRQVKDRTEHFLDNERRTYGDNYQTERKPEVRHVVLKQRSNTEASSPEYFIANVANRRSCTSEAFIYVEGGQPEDALTICYIDRDDDVFKN